MTELVQCVILRPAYFSHRLPKAPCRYAGDNTFWTHPSPKCKPSSPPSLLTGYKPWMQCQCKEQENTYHKGISSCCWVTHTVPLIRARYKTFWENAWTQMTGTHRRKINPQSRKTYLQRCIGLDRQPHTSFPTKTLNIFTSPCVNLLNNSKLTKNREKIHFLQTDFKNVER